MIPLYPAQLISKRDKIVESDGTATNIFVYLVKALFDRSGMQAGIPFSVAAAVVAAGTTQATATVLAADFNDVLTGAGGVALAQLQPAQTMVVFNGLGGNLNVYPTGAGSINALAAHAPFVLGTGKTQIFTCRSLNAQGGSFFRTVTLG